MCKRLKRFAFIAVAVLAASIVCSCGSGPDKVPPERAETLRELGNAMAGDLSRDILPYREAPEMLADMGYVLDNNGRAYGADVLAKFFVAYDSGKDSEVTIVFANKTFVVARVVFSGGKGYYLRYEYDSKNPDSIAVNGKLIDKVALKHQDDPPVWEMSLTWGKKNVASFKLKNPV